MKKSLHIIFSFYILFLSTIACGDVKDCNEVGLIKTEVSTNHSSHEHKQESCTPFCVCSCCGSSAITIFNKNEILIAEAQIDKKFLYKTSDILEVFITIWQPPKIS